MFRNGLIASLLLLVASVATPADEIHLTYESARMADDEALAGLLPQETASGIQPGLPWEFEEIVGHGHYPVFGQSDEIVYKIGGSGSEARIFSTTRGVLLMGTGNIRSLDGNVHGEIVYADLSPSSGISVFSTERGLLVPFANEPSINQWGEVVYTQGGTIHSTRRGALAEGYDPHLNGWGEVVFNASGTQILHSTERGELGPGIWPSLNDEGEVAFVAKDEFGVTQLHTTDGPVTSRVRFPEPHLDEAGCGSPFGEYQRGVLGKTDFGQSGEIVFTRWLAIGPYPTSSGLPDDHATCSFYVRSVVMKARRWEPRPFSGRAKPKRALPVHHGQRLRPAR